MTWKDVAKKVALGGAQVLARVLPLPGFAGDAVRSVVAKIAGADAEAPDAVAAALDARPELLVELRKYEMDHETELARLAGEGEQREASDMANMHELEGKLSSSTDWFVRRSRPAMPWVLVVSVAHGFVIVPTLSLFLSGTPQVPVYPMMFWVTVIGTFLGYAGLRTLEKLKGTA